MLKTRILAALVFTPLLVGVVIVGGVWLKLTCMVLALLLLGEFISLTLEDASPALKILTMCFGILAAARTSGFLEPLLQEPLTYLGVVCLLLAALAAPHTLAKTMVHAALGCLGIAWCAQTLPYLARLRDLPQNGTILAVLSLLSTWAADTGAYFAGRAFGKHKLYPKVSPSKTWEGAVGGALAAAAVAAALNHVFAGPLSMLQAAALGLVAAWFGLLGDLCESLLKRSVGKKDSSNLIPGHGGVFDRFDGVLFAVPAVYFSLVWLILR